jgi:hypothetical protein
MYNYIKPPSPIKNKFKTFFWEWWCTPVIPARLHFSDKETKAWTGNSWPQVTQQEAPAGGSH